MTGRNKEGSSAQVGRVVQWKRNYGMGNNNLGENNNNGSLNEEGGVNASAACWENALS